MAAMEMFLLLFLDDCTGKEAAGTTDVLREQHKQGVVLDYTDEPPVGTCRKWPKMAFFHSTPRIPPPSHDSTRFHRQPPHDRRAGAHHSGHRRTNP
jgi:hypothetical protein